MFSRREFLKLLSAVSLSTPLFIANRNKKNLPQITKPNILILVFDALSARNISLYGYRRETTPNLNKFAENAIVYHRHYAGGNFTTPGTASLLSGTLPWTHHAFSAFATMLNKPARTNVFSILPKGYTRFGYTQNPLANLLLYQLSSVLDILPPTEITGLNKTLWSKKYFKNDFDLAFRAEHILRAKDYPLPGLLAQSVLEKFQESSLSNGLNKQYKTQFPLGVPFVSQGMHFTLENSMDWTLKTISELPNPYFAYFHFWPPHEPYLTRNDFIDIFRDGWKSEQKPIKRFSMGVAHDKLNEARIQYDEYIAYVDSEFGRFHRNLKQQELYNNTIIIVTSDHGEMFERGILSHVTPTLYDPIIHIPLIIKLPNQSTRMDIHTPTSCIDILPTIRYLTNNAIPVQQSEGHILPGIIPQTSPQSERAIFAIQAKSNSKFKPLTKGTIMMVKGHYKLINYSGYSEVKNAYELYNLEEDPEELNDLYKKNNPISESLKIELQQQIEHHNLLFKQNR